MLCLYLLIFSLGAGLIKSTYCVSQQHRVFNFTFLLLFTFSLGAGIMRESLDFHTDVAQPVILITRATYGELHGNDTSKIIDVTNDIQAQVDERTLTIEREVNLNKLFHWDPSPGMYTLCNFELSVCVFVIIEV